jgi:hypothetical protein
MPDQDERINDSAYSDEPGGFRESTLHFFQPEDAAALRRIGKLLHTMILEGSPYFGGEDQSLTSREMDAALADLVDVRDVFWNISREAETTSLHPADAKLSRFAGEVYQHLDKLINIVQGVLA